MERHTVAARVEEARDSKITMESVGSLPSFCGWGGAVIMVAGVVSGVFTIVNTLLFHPGFMLSFKGE